MTLGEAKEKVYMLLDEHSIVGMVEHDADIELKMVRFFDMAQKTLSQIKKIIRVRKITPQAGKTTYQMPADFRAVYRIWRDGKAVTSRYRWMGGKTLIIPEREAGQLITVEYIANPDTIEPDADDDYEFEIAEDAAECMPYYVAAQHLLPDLVMNYEGMLQMYNHAVSLLDTSVPGENVRVTNKVFRR